ncbi:MAG: hypothetical protein KUG78_07100 [Kangiellaceae bacterium]|nr:hypothetical protein [Kangiellaceae bacterium]
MYVESIYLIIGAEIALVAVLSCVGLAWYYRNKKKLWQRGFKDVRKRLNKLRVLKQKYNFVKENLHNTIDERNNLKEQLDSEAKNTSELKTQIESLNVRLNQQNKELDSVKAELCKHLEAVTIYSDDVVLPDEKTNKEKVGLSSEKDNSIEKAMSRQASVEEPVESKKVSYLSPDQSNWDNAGQEEFSRLKVMNVEQKGLIATLKSELFELSSEGGLTTPEQSIIPRLEQMLKESDTCIKMLEEELSVVVMELNDRSLQLANLGKQDSNRIGLLEQNLDNASSDQAKAEREFIEKQLADANAMSMTMMTANGDQSNIISFARNSINCDCLDALAEQVLNIVQNYQLDGNLQLRGRKETLNKSKEGFVSESNTKLLSDDLSGERFEQKGGRLSIRFDKMSLVAHGLPEDDPDTCARYKDSLAVVMELANEHLKNLDDEHALHQQQAVLKKVIRTTQDTITKVEEQFKFQAQQSKLIINSMTDVLGNPTFAEKMDSSIQPVYRGIISETRERFDELHDDSMAVDKSFAKIIDELSRRI